jgi:23S rRNA (guanosine2251-2'-O)-methyltransferase
MAPVTDLVAPGPDGSVVVVLDGVTNPANVGMILRSATAAGVDGVVLPHVGSPSVDPLVVKASAGVAYRAPILRCRQAADGVRALRALGYRVVGLAADAATDLWRVEVPRAVAFVLGNETSGLSPATAQLVDDWVAVPMANGVESLNVADTAAVVCFELARRRAARAGPPRVGRR